MGDQPYVRRPTLRERLACQERRALHEKKDGQVTAVIIPGGGPPGGPALGKQSLQGR